MILADAPFPLLRFTSLILEFSLGDPKEEILFVILCPPRPADPVDTLSVQAGFCVKLFL